MNKKHFLFKTLLILATLFFISCPADTNPVNISPPDWIIGKWTYTTNQISYTFTFTSDDIISDTGSYKADFSAGEYAEKQKSKEIFQYTITTIVEQVYTFRKISDTTLSYTNSHELN